MWYQVRWTIKPQVFVYIWLLWLILICLRIETEERGSQLVCPHTPEFKKRAQSLLVVVSSEPDGSYEDFTSRVRKYNTMKPFEFPLPAVFGNKFAKVTILFVLHFTLEVGV